MSEGDAWGILPRLREERKPLEQEIAAPANVVTLHPGAVKRYLEAVNDLATSLLRRNGYCSGGSGIGVPGHHHSSGKRTPQVTGRLTALIGAEVPPISVGISLVAEVRYHRSPRRDWPLFTLELDVA